MSIVFGSRGLLSGTGILKSWWARVPGFIRVMLRGGVIGALLLLAASSVLVAVNLVLNFNQVASVISGLKLSGGDLAMFALVNLALVPNAIAYWVAYLVGPGFAIGTNTDDSFSLSGSSSLGQRLFKWSQQKSGHQGEKRKHPEAL